MVYHLRFLICKTDKLRWCTYVSICIEDDTLHVDFICMYVTYVCMYVCNFKRSGGACSEGVESSGGCYKRPDSGAV